MSNFSFGTSPAAESYCERIVDDLVRLVSISRRDAIARVNRQWNTMSFVADADYRLLTHQTTDDWAHDIYYGKQSMWWRPGSRPQPLPAPEDI